MTISTLTPDSGMHEPYFNICTSYAPSIAFNKSNYLLYARSLRFCKPIQLVLALKNSFIIEDIATIVIYVIIEHDILSQPNALQAITR